MGLKKEIGGEIKVENERSDKKQKSEKRKMKEIKIEGKKNLIVIDEGKIYTYYGDDMQVYIDSIPEDYNVYYILENETSVIINKDYKKIAPMVKYLLGNVYESLELKYMRRIMWIFIGLWVFTMIFMILIKIYSPSMKDEINFIKDYVDSISVEETIIEDVDIQESTIDDSLPIIEESNVLPSGVLIDNQDTDKGSREY